MGISTNFLVLSVILGVYQWVITQHLLKGIIFGTLLMMSPSKGNSLMGGKLIYYFIRKLNDIFMNQK
jgi:hypothetical protein